MKQACGDMRSSNYEKVDWFGQLMQTRKEDGEPYIASYGQVDTKRRHVTWHRIDHRYFDGVGGYAEVLTRLGHCINRLPGDHHPPPSSFFSGLVTWWRSWKHINSRSVSWNKKWASRYTPSLKHRYSPQLSWHVFTKEETRVIERIAIKSGASVNSYLLSHLSNVVADEFVDKGSTFHWMIPTNLRGALQLSNPKSNHCSMYSLNVRDNETPRGVQKRSREIYLRGDDWAFHWSIKFMGKLLPNKLSRLFQKDMERKNPHIGCFTNIGSWHHSIPHMPMNADEGWVVVPTTNQSNPVGAGTITWNRRLSIALELHPSLRASPEETEDIFIRWKEKVISFLQKNKSNVIEVECNG